jgi:hypothetical protein
VFHNAVSFVSRRDFSDCYFRSKRSEAFGLQGRHRMKITTIYLLKHAFNTMWGIKCHTDEELCNKICVWIVEGSGKEHST